MDIEEQSLDLKRRLGALCDKGITLRSDYSHIESGTIKANKENEQINTKPKYVKKNYFEDESDAMYKDGNMILLTEMHPGVVNFSELARGMSPISVNGLEHLKGVRGETFQQMNKRYGIRKGNLHPNGEQTKPYDRKFCDIINKTQNISGVRDSKQESVVGDDGEAHERPLDCSHVWIHYAFYVEGSKVPFDSSIYSSNKKNSRYSKNPIKIEASCNSVIPGLALAVRWLPVGARGRFILPSDCMFGVTGCQQLGVDPGASILLLLHSIRCLDANAIKRYENLDAESKTDFSIVFPLVTSVNTIGKDFFFRKRIVMSLKMYSQSLTMLSACRKTRENYEDFTFVFNKTTLNLALCHELTDRPRNAMFFLDTVDLDSCEPEQRCKFMFIKSKCLLMLGELDESMCCVRRCHAMRPSSIEIGNHLAAVDEALFAASNIQKKTVKSVDENDDAAFLKSCSASIIAFGEITAAGSVDKFTIRLPGGVSPEEYQILKSVMAKFNGWEFKILDRGEISFEKRCFK